MRTHRRPGLTLGRIIKGAIIFGPPAAFAYSAYSNASGTTSQKVVNGGLAGLVQAYTGLNPVNGQWYGQSLVYGWAGPVAVTLASKIGLFRMLRV